MVTVIIPNPNRQSPKEARTQRTAKPPVDPDETKQNEASQTPRRRRRRTVGKTVNLQIDEVMQRTSMTMGKTNPNLIVVPLIPITYPSAQLHENSSNNCIHNFIPKEQATSNFKNQNFKTSSNPVLL